MNIIKSIKIEVQGKELDLTIDEAVKLHDELEKVIGRPVVPPVNVDRPKIAPQPWKPPTVTPYLHEGPNPPSYWDGTTTYCGS